MRVLGALLSLLLAGAAATTLPADTASSEAGHGAAQPERQDQHHHGRPSGDHAHPCHTGTFHATCAASAALTISGDLDPAVPRRDVHGRTRSDGPYASPVSDGPYRPPAAPSPAA